jgi:hypothetical protein
VHRNTTGSRKVAAPAAGGGVRAHQKGRSLKVSHAFSFASSRLVTQPVTSLIFPRAATVEYEQLQREFPLLARMEGPAVVPPELMRLPRTYREAVRLCWELRRLRKLTYRQLAAEAGLVYQHVGDYFNLDDLPRRRDLPGDAVEAVEAVLGNTAISQWHAMRAQLTVLEVLQASARRVAA